MASAETVAPGDVVPHAAMAGGGMAPIAAGDIRAYCGSNDAAALFSFPWLGVAMAARRAGVARMPLSQLGLTPVAAFDCSMEVMITPSVDSLGAAMCAHAGAASISASALVGALANGIVLARTVCPTPLGAAGASFPLSRCTTLPLPPRPLPWPLTGATVWSALTGLRCAGAVDFGVLDARPSPTRELRPLDAGADAEGFWTASPFPYPLPPLLLPRSPRPPLPPPRPRPNSPLRPRAARSSSSRMSSSNLSWDHIISSFFGARRGGGGFRVLPIRSSCMKKAPLVGTAASRSSTASTVCSLPTSLRRFAGSLLSSCPPSSSSSSSSASSSEQLTLLASSERSSSSSSRSDDCS
mmetsp:Transcript_6547/g.20456  ORF Transcript_6547/g.20456 Transcript_6547/m.20456 type:complete len:354 (-) Transcript_6547:118-1179(-)